MTISLGLAQTNLQLFRQLHAAGAGPEAVLQVRSDYETACLLFGDLIRSSGKPFLCHVVGTAGALAKEGAPLTVVRAGLLHAAFSHGRFRDGTGGATRDHRCWLRERAGGEVEELVHAYSEYRFDDGRIDEALADPGAVTGSERRLMLMRVCNRVDDGLDHGAIVGGKPVFRDPAMLGRLRSLSLALGFDFCARALARIEAEMASGDWLRTDRTFRHDTHRPTVLRFARQVLLKRGP